MELIRGENFQKLCNVYIGEPSDFQYNPKIAVEKEKCLALSEIPTIYHNPLMVFVYAHRIADFRKTLDRFQYPFILVTHNSDQIVDSAVMGIAEHPRVLFWFAQNCCVQHPKLRFLPIGIANSHWPHGDPAAFSSAHRKPWAEKQNLLYFQFSLHTNYTARLECLRLLERWFPFGSSRGMVDYLESLSDAKFCIAPHGNGPDCHRIWEAYFCGTIPIILRSAFADWLAAEMPVVVVDSWSHVTPAFLTELSEREWNIPFEKLDIRYYRRNILVCLGFSEMPMN